MTWVELSFSTLSWKYQSFNCKYKMLGWRSHRNKVLALILNNKKTFVCVKQFETRNENKTLKFFLFHSNERKEKTKEYIYFEIQMKSKQKKHIYWSWMSQGNCKLFEKFRISMGGQLRFQYYLPLAIDVCFCWAFVEENVKGKKRLNETDLDGQNICIKRLMLHTFDFVV